LAGSVKNRIARSVESELGVAPKTEAWCPATESHEPVAKEGGRGGGERVSEERTRAEGLERLEGGRTGVVVAARKRRGIRTARRKGEREEEGSRRTP